MKHRIFAFIFAIGLLPFSMSTVQAEFTAAQKDDLNKLFETYIKENPLVVRDALIALAQQEEKDRRAEAMAMLAIDEGDPFMGAGDEADVILYEFSDYNCGYCKRVFQQIQIVLAEDPKVRLTLKEYPILAESSLDAARAGIAAGMQGKFEAFHTGMMTWRGPISLESVMSVAQDSGLDMARLEADMASAEVDAILQRTRATAQALDVSGTPALVIGDEFIPGAIDASQIKEIIAQQREKS